MYKYNNHIFYVVKNKEDQVLAFTIMTPITEKLYNKMLTGEINDMYDFPFEDVLQEKKSDYSRFQNYPDLQNSRI